MTYSQIDYRYSHKILWLFSLFSSFHFFVAYYCTLNEVINAQNSSGQVPPNPGLDGAKNLPIK